MKGKNNMEPIVIAGIAAGAAIVAGTICFAVRAGKKPDNPEKLLETCFGEHTYIQNVTLAQVRDWIKNREDMLRNNSKAIVFKLNSDNVKKINKIIDISRLDGNYLAITIMEQSSNEMLESILIKYDTLEDNLEEFLAKGNGTAVIGG